MAEQASKHEPMPLEGMRAALLGVAENAIAASDGRLRIAFNEEDQTEEFREEAQRFIKLDGKRLGRDIELYGFMGADIMGWEALLPTFLEEVLLPIRRDLPDSYLQAAEKLQELGKEIYTPLRQKRWEELLIG